MLSFSIRRGSLAALLLCLAPLQVQAQEPAPAMSAVPDSGAPEAVAPATAAPVAPVPTPAPAMPTRGTLKIEGDAQKLSVFAIGIDAPELLTAIAARAGIKLVVDDTVSRRITISEKDRPAREVIASIAGAYGLAAADVDGVTIISEGIPRSPSSYLLSDIDQISTKYVDAANARNLLPVFLQDYVKVNSEQNAVVLSAPAEVLRKFRADIAGFDIPASQILVDLLLVELTDTGVDALNLNLSNANSGNGIFASPSEGTLSFRALTTLPDAFSLNLIALQEQGRARVRANPRIATVSGRRASIFVGRQRYIVTPIDTGGGQRNFIDAGVRLAITPYTGGEKQILVDVDTEVSTLSALDPVTRLPEKSTRTANTKVRVNDGQTIVIGGLKQSEARDVRTRVPVLGNLPILGPLLFRSRNKRTTETELVLFITPRILSDTGHLPAAEEADLQKRFLGPDISAPLPPSPPVETLPRFKEAAPLPVEALPGEKKPADKTEQTQPAPAKTTETK
jgi:type II secretory pathway component GspD/PulD (secretin)